MVRNVASIASLCETLPHRPNAAQPQEQGQQEQLQPSPEPTTSRESRSPPPIMNENKSHAWQGCWPMDRQYERSFTQRVASGRATPEEIAAFNAIIQRQADPEERSDGSAALSDYQMQLQLREQQTKKRLLAARAVQSKLLQEERIKRQLKRNLERESSNGSSSHASQNQKLETHGHGHALQDHQMELMLLQQQRKKQSLTARQEAEAGTPLFQSGSNGRFEEANQKLANGMSNQSGPDQELEKVGNHALEDYEKQLRLLDQQNKKRLLMARQEREQEKQSRFTKATSYNAEQYAEPFCRFLSENPTVFHAVAAMKQRLRDAGFTELSERDSWSIKRSGSYFVERNGSALIAFSVGAKYESGNGAAVVAGHIDALTAKLKPVSKVPNKAGYLQLGVAPYAGGMNSTWWDRDLGIAGRVHLKKEGKIVTKLVNLDYPIARVPTLAPHFGAAAQGPFNPETQMVPILGLESSYPMSTVSAAGPFSKPSLLGDTAGTFAKTQPPALVWAIEDALHSSIDWDEERDDGRSMLSDDDDDDDEDRLAIGEIVNWELELYDVQPATRGGLRKELIYGGRIDDKLCSWAALEALVEAQRSDPDSSILKVVGLFDDEEIGSLLRQGARGNFLPSVLERAAGSLADHKPASDLMGRTYANSFLVSSDVTHAVNPNFLSAYLENHAPHLNVGVAIAADPNGHMTTDSVSTTIFQRCAEKAGAKLQVFQIRNDSRSGGTIGPMTSSATGMRSIDAGLPQLSMHSIRATTGALDPGLGVITFKAFLNGFEEVDKEFR
ncbi:hypothetical protein TI39_contig4250g00006 [Zymoseptoria brevis]|uniref:Aspartyl aminopeptidase like protein n=1 Tax=Zymoseptoria brevis TaxID=1047168 RepID=A0A0F4G8U5_9PEZI|nr:hypothetical protein TI39_contig4250g00006 [Zymoseptoria brevis]